ncbi:hypothetical protein [Streptomyces sp. NPDC057909]|uniref:hypothetical protein n=1 Tax=Streptomyces sp. NPDC057909 TaxID=3346277 RepID=UPI0036ECC894
MSSTFDIETGQDLERRAAGRRRRPLPVLTPVASLPGLCQVKLSHVPAYGLDSAPTYAEVSRLGPGPHTTSQGDGLGAWTGLTPLCVHTLALPAALFPVLRRTSAVAALRPVEPVPYCLAAEAASPDVRPSTSGRAAP